MTLRGPAHPENFRVQVGRYGDRWYQDNLPHDGTWGPTPEPVPSVTTVKNAWPKFLTNWAAQEAAAFAVDNLDAWSKLERAAAVDLIAKAHTRTRDAAGARGTSIHECIEVLAESGEMILDSVPAEYEAVVKQLVDDLQPEFVVSEAVAIKQGPEGYGGTMDGIARLNRYGTRGIDWKSRKAGKGGTAYPDEFAQVAGYLDADYLIVAGDGVDAVRVPVPEVDGIAIITIEPAGYHVCAPDDHGRAFEAWRGLRRFWSVQTLNPPRSTRLVPEVVSGGTDIHAVPVVGSVEGPAAAAPSSPGEGADVAAAATAPSGCNPPSPERQQWLLDRIEAIKDAGHAQTIALRWPVDCPDVPLPAAVRAGTVTWSPEHLDAVAKCCTEVEKIHQLPFPGDDPAAPKAEPTFAQPVEERSEVRRLRPAPDDGHVPDAAVEELRARLKALPEHQRHHVVAWSRQAIDHDPQLAWNMGGPPVLLRRYAIAAAAVELVQLCEFDDGGPDMATMVDEDRVRTALSIVLGDEALQETLPVGALLGALTIDEADRLATHRLALEDGTPRLIAAA